MLPLKYPADFTHFEYTNPAAPKAGEMRLPQMGTFDNYNVILEKGRNAAGYDLSGGLVYDKLLEPAIDEPVSYYGRLAEGVAQGPGAGLDRLQAARRRYLARWPADHRGRCAVLLPDVPGARLGGAAHCALGSR